MSINADEIKKIAFLARLSLDKQECLELEHNLDRIVDYITLLQEVDVTKVEPMFHAGDRDLSLRSDEVSAAVGQLGLQGSAGYDEGLVRVPKIID